MSDHTLRRYERAVAADPGNTELLQRYIAVLERLRDQGDVIESPYERDMHVMTYTPAPGEFSRGIVETLERRADFVGVEPPDFGDTQDHFIVGVDVIIMHVGEHRERHGIRTLNRHIPIVRAAIRAKEVGYQYIAIFLDREIHIKTNFAEVLADRGFGDTTISALKKEAKELSILLETWMPEDLPISDDEIRATPLYRYLTLPTDRTPGYDHEDALNIARQQMTDLWQGDWHPRARRRNPGKKSNILWVGPGMGDPFIHMWGNPFSELLDSPGATLEIDRFKLIDVKDRPKFFFNDSYTEEHSISQEAAREDFFNQHSSWDIVILDMIEAWQLGRTQWDWEDVPFEAILRQWEEALKKLAPFQVWVRHDRLHHSSIAPDLSSDYEIVVRRHWRPPYHTDDNWITSNAAYWTAEAASYFSDFDVWQRKT